MVTGLTPEQLGDVVKSTLNIFRRDEWVSEMSDLQDYTLFNDMCKNKKEKLSMSRGDKVRIITDHNHSAEVDKMFGTVDFMVDDAAEEGNVPWRRTKANMAFDIQEPDMNSGDAAMFDLIKTRYARMRVSALELAERLVWGKPTDSTDNEKPWGLKYWIVQNATTGFNGGNPAGFTAGRAGISSGTYSRHKNYTGTYTSYDDTPATGLIDQMERAAVMMEWKEAVQHASPERKGYGKSIYMDYDTRIGLKNVTKTMNDSLGFDLSTPDPLFRGAQLKYVSWIDQNETNGPVYMIDHNSFFAVFLKDWYMKDIEISVLPHQPTVTGVVQYMVYNFVCHNLRKQAVFYDAS